MWCGKTDRGRRQSERCERLRPSHSGRNCGWGRQGNHRDNDEGAERQWQNYFCFFSQFCVFSFPIARPTETGRRSRWGTKQTKQNKNWILPLWLSRGSNPQNEQGTGGSRQAGSGNSGGLRTLTTGKCTNIQPTRSRNKARGRGEGVCVKSDEHRRTGM